MRHFRRFSTGASVLALSFATVFASFKYVKSVAQSSFESDILKVKQSFYEGIKAAESAVEGISSFAEQIEINEEIKFGRFSKQLMAKLPFISSTAFYRYITTEKRALFEENLLRASKGAYILQSDDQQESGVAKRALSNRYLPLAWVDEDSKATAYFGWDLLSDPSKFEAAEKTLLGSIPTASPTYLLDSGNVAMDIFSTIKNPDGSINGLTSVTLDLTKLLGEKKWRQGLTLIMTTALGTETTPKDIFRSLDDDPPQWPPLGTLQSSIEIEKFNQKLGLKFEKELNPSRINISIILIATLGATILAILAFFLLNFYEKLQRSLLKVEEANQTLEKKVLERTQELRTAHAEIKEILDNIDEIVLPVSPNGFIEPNFSFASKKILDQNQIEGRHLKDVLFKTLDQHDEHSSRHLFAIDMLATFDEFQWSISRDELLKIIPYNTQNQKNQILSIKYSPIFESDVLRKLIVVANDVTEIMSLKASVEDQRRDATIKDAVFGEIARSDKNLLRSFLNEAEARIRVIKNFTELNIEERRNNVLPMLREMHTLKGGSRSVGLKFLAQIIHETEDRLEPLRHAVAADSYQSIDWNINAIDEALKIYDEYRMIFHDLFAGENTKNQPNTVLRLIPILKTKNNDLNNITDWLTETSNKQLISLVDTLASFFPSLKELAMDLGKKIDIMPPDWDLYLTAKFEPTLKEAFTHALRNAVDHGIETPTDREKKRKNPEGKIWFELKEEHNFAVVSIVDDGNGVNLEKVHQIARSKRLVDKKFEEMSQKEIFELLFLPGFSTKQEISDVSGRGIGLDAVRTSLQQFGAIVSINNENKCGSRFELKIPIGLASFKISNLSELRKIA